MTTNSNLELQSLGTAAGGSYGGYTSMSIIDPPLTSNGGYHLDTNLTSLGRGMATNLKSHYVSKNNVMVSPPTKKSASPGAGTNWWWDYITAIPSSIGYTISKDTSSAVGSVSAAASDTASGIGTAINSVGSTASNTAGYVGSGLELAYAKAAKTVGSGVAAGENLVSDVVTPVGKVVSSVVSTGENAVSILAWTPFLFLALIVAVFFFFPEKSTAAVKTAVTTAA